MSKRPIDEKIVALKLDNSHFKKYALEATGMFEKLTDTFKDTKKFNLNNIVHSLADVGKAVTGVDFSPLIDGADGASGRFAALGVIAVTSLSNLTNKIVDAGMAMAQSLTTDPIRAGFSEYELKMNATQTILASTGEELSVVNGYLEELNEYSDKTIYSFADMTNNIGKFTNAGVSLKDSVKAIQGVSNVAAVSGANTEEASRAMYNFSQALSQGHVKLIDWKSIENANMSTVEFKEQLLESAVAAGNLEKTADGMYRVLTTNGQGSSFEETIDATKNFNDSLAYQWMTTDALIGTLSDYADETTDIGKKAFKAAKEIKTFSQMVDTIKEGVESGWAKTFELIFGDYYTAIDLWTGLSQAIEGFLQGRSDRRNNFLQKFVDLGGREKIIQSVVNLYKTLLNLIKPITNGFKKMIPESTGKSWVLLASALELVTRALKIISGPIGKAVGAVFTGMFGIIRGGIELVKFMGKLLSMLVPKNLGPNVKKLGSALSGLYSNIKDVFKVFAESEGVQKAIQTMITLIEKVGVKATEAFGKASEWLSDKFAKGIDYIIENLPYIEERLIEATAWVENFAEDATVFLKDFSVNAQLYLEELWANLKGGWSNAKDWTKAFFETASNWMDILKDKFGEAFTFIWNVVKTIWDFVTSLSLTDVLKAGAFTGILIYGKKIIEMFKEAKEKVMDFLGLGDGDGEKPFKLLDGLKDALSNLEQSVNAGTLLAIAGSLLILVGAIKMLEGMDHADISKGLATVVTGLIGLVGALKVMSGMKTGIFKSIATIALIGAISTSMVILAGALKIMSSIDGDTLGRSLYALAATLTMLVAAIRLMTIPKGEMLASAGFVVGLSIAIRIMVGAIEDLGSMDVEQLKVGLGSMGIILLELAVFMRLASGAKINPASAVSLVIIVGAVKLMVSEISKIADMPADEIKKGLITLGIILLELGIFARLASGASVVGAGVGMIAVAYAINLLIPSIRELGKMDYPVLKQGLIGLAIGLAAISASMALAGVGGLGSGLGILAVALAINALVPPIKALGAMDIKVLAIGIGAMAAALLVIGGTAYLLSAASVSLLAFGAGLFLVGAAFALVGVGMVGLSTGLAAFAAMSVASIYGIGKVFKALLDVLKEAIPNIVETIMTMLEAILASIENHMPNLMQSGLNIIMSILEGIRNKIYAVTDVVLDIITAFVDAIADNIETVVASAVNLIIKFVDGLANTIRTEGPRFTKAVMNLFESILEVVILASLDVLEILFHWIPGVSEALDKAGDSATSALREAFDVAEVAEEGTDDFIGEVDKKRGKAKKSGSDLAKELKEGMNEVDGYDTVGAEKTQEYVDGMDTKTTIADNKAKAIALDSKTSMASVGGYNTVGASKVEQYTRGMGSKSSLANNKAKAIAVDSKKSMSGVNLTTTGSNAGQQYVRGVSSRASGARQSGVKVAKEVQNGVNTVSLYNTGTNLAAGLARGLDKSIWSVSQKARELAHAVKYNIEGPMMIMSPSRVMIKDGMYIGQGLVIGLSRMIGKVASKSRDVSLAVKDNVTRYSEGLSDALNANMDMTPTITPVFDLSNMDLDMLDRFNVGSIYFDKSAVESAIGNRGGSEASVDYVIDSSNKRMEKVIESLIDKVDRISDRAIIIENAIDGRVFASSTAKYIKPELANIDNHMSIIKTGGVNRK